MSKKKTENITEKPEKKKRRGKEDLPETEQQRKRKLLIKIIAAAAAFVVALIAFSTGISSYLHRDPGYYQIDTDPIADALLYQRELVLTCYFDGKSSDIRASLTETRREYSAALSHIYRLLDPDKTYEGYVNLAYINAHRGEEIALDPILFDILVRAKELTAKGYFNLFGGALYKEWSSISSLDDPASFDPLVNEYEAERLSVISEKTADLDNFDLEIISEADRTVKFTVSDRYLRVIDGYELSRNVLDLGFLKKAFEIEYTAKCLEEAGITNGYLASSEGDITFALSGLREGGVYLNYTLYEDAPAQACRIAMEPGTACCQLRSFRLEDPLGYYSVTSDGAEHLRHPHYNWTNAGVYDDLLSAFTVSYAGGVVEAAEESYRLITAPDTEEAMRIAREAGESDMLIGFITKAEPAVVNVDKAHESELIFTEGRPFAAKTL